MANVDIETLSTGLSDIIERVVVPLRDRIATIEAGKSVKLLPHDVAGLGEDLGKIVREQIAKATAPLLARISALENRAAVDYKGVYAEGATYARGDAVTDQSAVWFCCAETATRPGKSSAWRLMLKSGR